MSFLWITNVTNKLKQNKRKPSPKYKSSNQSLARDFIPLKKNNKKINASNVESIKRISLLTFLTGHIKIKGSMTVEASLILPLLIFFFLNLTTAIEVIRLSCNLDMAMWQTGKQMSVYAYAYDSLQHGKNDLTEESYGYEENSSLSDKLAGLVFTSFWAGNEVIKDAGEEYLNQSPLKGGADGLFFGNSSFLEDNDCIDLVASYQAVPWISTAGFSGFRMKNRVLVRAWTGYELKGQKEEVDYVYITETGVVYHETKDCTHLKLVIREILFGDVEILRNESGGKYELCWLCKDSDNNGRVYITRTGTKYHYQKECSGLKRTILTIKRSEAGKYKQCSRCGKP